MTTEQTQSQAHQDTLTKRQNEVLEVIKTHIHQHGAPPTRAEIAKKLGFRSVNAAEDHLKALARKGAIALFPGTSRGIQLIGQHSIGVPVVHFKDPEQALLHENNIERRYKVDLEFFSPKADFFFKVPSNLANATLNIQEGDLLALLQTEQPQNKQMVLIRTQHTLLLRPFIAEQDAALKIEGVVIGLIRKMVPLNE